MPGTTPSDGSDAASSLRAADVFSRIADRSPRDDVAARALQAAARCLSKAGRRDDALAVLTGTLAQPRFRAAVDPRGRLIAPSALLLALQLVDDPEDPVFRSTAAALRGRLIDYGEPVIPASQRRFLMRELLEVVPDAPRLDTLEAEDLAASYLDAGTVAGAPAVLTRSDHLWLLTSTSGRVIALHREDAIRARLAQAIETTDLAAEMTPELLSPGHDPDPTALFVSFAADAPLPGWRLTLQLDEQTLIDPVARRRVAVYLWTGVLVIVVIAAATALIARAIREQLRAARLKNDLLATVSHELKTPLASMRLLVDTLLEGRSVDEERVREYLQLISKENNRLSRLVDNFLSFARMERGKQQFDREEIPGASVVRSVTTAAGERFDAPGCRLEVEVAPDLPSIDADSDALVTALLNLLDNAYKYTGDDKRIVLRAFTEGDHVCFSVRDNGIGLSKRARGRVFERFYQVDQSLARRDSGCGLGLSIVRFIVAAHGGTVDVESRPGEGSTFTIRLPATGDGTADGRSHARREAVG